MWDWLDHLWAGRRGPGVGRERGPTGVRGRDFAGFRRKIKTDYAHKGFGPQYPTWMCKKFELLYISAGELGTTA